jgi:hypothetical protein
MKIEIGKEYRVQNKFKKGFVEREVFKENDTGDVAIIETLWRQGTYIVKIVDEEERALLEQYQGDDQQGDIEVAEFSEIEFVDSWDECANNVTIRQVDKDEARQEEIQELVEDEGYEWLMENNYDSWDTESFFSLPLAVEEVDPNNRYAT